MANLEIPPNILLLRDRYYSVYKDLLLSKGDSSSALSILLKFGVECYIPECRKCKIRSIGGFRFIVVRIHD